MTLYGLALRNAFLRNKTRSLLTMLGVIIAAVAFLFLRTVLAAWYASSDASSADRVVTRNAISLEACIHAAFRPVAHRLLRRTRHECRNLQRRSNTRGV